MSVHFVLGDAYSTFEDVMSNPLFLMCGEVIDENPGMATRAMKNYGIYLYATAKILQYAGYNEGYIKTLVTTFLV